MECALAHCECGNSGVTAWQGCHNLLSVLESVCPFHGRDVILQALYITAVLMMLMESDGGIIAGELKEAADEAGCSLHKLSFYLRKNNAGLRADV